MSDGEVSELEQLLTFDWSSKLRSAGVSSSHKDDDGDVMVAG